MADKCNKFVNNSFGIIALRDLKLFIFNGNKHPDRAANTV